MVIAMTEKKRYRHVPKKKKRVPRLKEIFAPCPVCGGTVGMTRDGINFCNACFQAWTTTGKPLTMTAAEKARLMRNAE